MLLDGKRLALALTMCLVAGCAHGVGSTMRRGEPAALSDDLPLPPLLDAVEREITFLESSRRARTFKFADRELTQAEYVEGLRRFVALGRQARSTAELLDAVRGEFEFYRAFPSGVLVTSYYQPVIAGSRARTDHYSQPLYRAPPDLAAPYYTRHEIDSGHVLDGRGLELCFVDPFDAFVIQTEGSGTIALTDGTTLDLAYAGNNGRPHERLSRFLTGAIPPKQMTMHTIEAYLRSLPEAEMRRYLEMNPRYVFFKPGNGEGAMTALGVPTTDGRTIATDARYCPKGALAFLVGEQPVFDAPDQRAPAAWRPLARFVLDQDTGGGIKDAHVDLFWGHGAEAGRYAGVMKQRGELYYLVPKKRP